MTLRIYKEGTINTYEVDTSMFEGENDVLVILDNEEPHKLMKFCQKCESPIKDRGYVKCGVFGAFEYHLDCFKDEYSEFMKQIWDELSEEDKRLW